MRQTIGNDARNTLSEITLAVLGQQEEEIDEDERFASYFEKQLDAIRLRRAEAHGRVDEIRRQARMAEAELSMIEEQCDAEQSVVCQFLIRLKARRMENDQEKREAARVCERAGYEYLHESLKVGA